MRFIIFFLLTLGLFQATLSQTFYKVPFAHTYSIVAVDSATGEIGAAVQSHWFSVGSVVIWAEAGVGAVATQSLVNVSFGTRGLALLKEGKSPREAVDILLSDDEGREVRQLAIIDARGNSAAHTGKNCIPAAGHIEQPYFSVQANLMEKETVWTAMEKAFRNASGPLAERMMAALEAAQAEGGDIRGQQSAAMVVVRGESTGKVWEDRLVDLRVDDHSEPLEELRRLLKVHRAYEHMNAGDLALETGDVDSALREYGAAEAMFPDNLEMQYWHAVSLANINRLEEALPVFQRVFAKDPNWKTLTPRLIPCGLLNVTAEQLETIMGE